MDLEDWLRRLGLERYEAAFRDTVLRSLTAEDLKELGIGPVGHRRKLLDAIAVLRTESVSKAVPPDTISTVDASPADTAERRQVTVMFSDLVGSTALSARMDPEDLRDIISAYQKCVTETVRRFGGFVARYLGDGVLAYFGYPQAHEDDAECAVRAGLESIAAVAGLKMRVTLQARVGIATGLVVVGDLIGSGSVEEQTVVGETPNIAARLQAIAEPNSLVIADNTRRLLGNLFELKYLGARDLKGVGKPVKAWIALRPSSVESRFDALHAAGLTNLVGREEEVELLLRRWSRAKTGEGQVVLLSGESGIGKSRLAVALLERLTTEPHTRLRYFCSPQHTDSAFYPIISQMERAAGFGRDDTAEAKLGKLDTLLAQTSTTVRDAALFAEMLLLPFNGRYPPVEATPQQRRQKTLEALILQIEVLTRSNPVLMIFEDAHWADPTSLEALGRALDRIAILPVMLVVTFRPEFEAPWIGRPNVTALTLNRLAQPEVGAIIDGLLGDELSLPAGIRQDIIERTDGIPLFIEEMTKAVLEAEGEGEARQTAASVPSPALAVPASLQASLMARLDRLGPAKEVAQIGAAIGREFSHALLASVMRQSEEELASALERLIKAGLLFRQGIPPDATYLFKHTLVQDAAYNTLLREPRRALHARIAEILEQQVADITENQPELLARHLTEAGLIDRAAGLWGKAGQQSLQRSALVEATERLSRALSQIADLPSTPALRREQIKLQVALITPLIHVKGPAAPETKAAGQRARLLIEEAEANGEPPEDPLLLFSVLYGFWIANLAVFNGELLRELAAQFLALAEKQMANAPLVVGHRMMSISLASTGCIRESLSYFDRALALYDPTEQRPLATRFGQDDRVCVLSYRSLSLWVLGYPGAALEDAHNALHDAREIGQAATLMFALYVTSLTHTFRGNYETAMAQLKELIAIADGKSAIWTAGGLMNQGWLLGLQGRTLEAIQMLTQGITAWRSTGTTGYAPMHLVHSMRAYADVGQFDNAWRCFDEAIALIERSKERWYESEIHRIAGEVAWISSSSNAAKAEAFLQRALTIAREQQAKSWELRAALSMARLWHELGNQQQAHDLLAPVYGWFTEGFDTPDLKQAKTLLDRLVS
jgi:class 3 adenylate cyclase/predicted ATPase